MKTFSKKDLANRIMALMLSVLLAVTAIPSSVMVVNAQTEEHPGYVTITVRDDSGNAVSDANVTYTIEEKQPAENGFTTISSSAVTDSYGTVEVLPAAQFFDDLTITAAVSKTGYQTAELESTDITSDTQDFPIELAEEVISDIEGVSIEVLNAEYNGEEQELVSVSATTEEVIVEYSTNGTDWSADVPKGVDADSYDIYVKLSKTGYKTYESGKLTAVISKKDITGIDITGNSLEYIEGTEQELVAKTGDFEPGDTVTWYVNDVDTGKQDIPTKLAVGEYKVKLVVERGKNYNKFEKEVTAEISNATLDLTGLSVKGLDSVYNGNPQEAVSVEPDSNTLDYTLLYQMDDDGDEEIDEAAWSTEIPKVTNAGSYIVWVKATKANYKEEQVAVTPAENAVAPYNVYIAKAAQTLSFDNYVQPEPSSDELTAEEMAVGKIFDFSATDSEQKVSDSTITYSIELGQGDDEVAAIDDQTGELTVYGAGKIIVKATLSGNDNYEECTISHELYISGKAEAGMWISVPNETVEYTLGNKAGIPENIAVHTEIKDAGTITYHIEKDSEAGLSIDAHTGIVSINDYKKLVDAIEASNGLLSVTVKQEKAEYKKEQWGNCGYPADVSSYTLKITMADIPEAPYKVYSADDTENELLSPNGNNGWYHTALVVMPAEGYEIIRADSLAKENPAFASMVRFGEMNGNNVFDQGIDAERGIYLKNSDTGEITKKIVLRVEKLDNVSPHNLNIVFPDAEEKDGVKYYGDEITVTFIASDETSGVEQFEWKYIKEAGASSSNLEADTGIVTAQLDTSDASQKRYIGTITLPKSEANQLRGNLQITAIDKAGNRSTSYTDTGVFVVDTIAPTQRVEYQLKDGVGSTQMVGSRHYFSNDVVFTFKIVEANFVANDVKVFVSKDGAAEQRQTLSWSNTDITDEHQATVALQDDGDYVVSMTYTDRSGKGMTSYTSETIVVDKTSPVVEFAYKDYIDEAAPQTAIVKITEHNFRKEDIVLDTIAKNIAGDVVNANNLQQYLRTCDWTSEGDVHTATIGNQFVDGIYELTFHYKDLALNSAAEVKPEKFIVDRTVPNTNQMSISYSNPVLETILSTVTFGFYNPSVTITFTAHDATSGIHHFIWRYLKEAGASDLNVAEYTDTMITAVQDAADKTKYTAVVTLPRDVAEQLRGTVSFTATDNYSNTSNRVTDDSHVLVVDTIAPTANVEYSTADNSLEGKDYYNKDLTATFTITEANFYKEDVKVSVRKDDGNAEIVVPNWTDTSTDVHVGTVVIPAEINHANDGDYVFTVEYKDRSNNEMVTYVSGVKVIDTTKPVIDVRYDNENLINTLTDSEGHQRKYFSSTQTATITIAEHNFNASDVRYTILAKDVAGNDLNAASYYTASSWSRNGDNNVLTITYPGDANYTFDIEYKDLARLDADAYETNYFTVDTTKPTDLTVSYSTSVLDTVLSAITFGFYNAKATVTITATDNISGINAMKYSYVKAEGVSSVNTELIDALVEASSINGSDGGAIGTATFEIPQGTLTAGSQFNGTINFAATDRANNESEYFRDTRRIVVDNIAPTAEVQYNAPVQTINGISYYDGDISATVTIQEANFYAEDVSIHLTRDGNVTPVNANWSDNGTDVHIGTFTITGDGDYFVGITYSDKSTNAMQEYTSEQMTIDTEIVEPTITVNGQEADGKAFKEEVVPAVNFDDKNFESCEVKMFRTSFEQKNVDVTEQFIADHISFNENGGSGEFDTFDKIAENDGIYTITAELADKAGHTIEKSITFTVNRFGSVYEYNDYLISLISDGGAYVQSVDQDFVITEYNADRLVSGSLDIEILRDGKPLDNSVFKVSPEINENVSTGTSGWYQYAYTIAKENFDADGVYKIAISSKDATGNSPENNNYKDRNILFRVDSTAPEITSISGLENPVVNATEQTVKYTVYDTIGLASVVAYVDGKEVDNITDFTEDANNYSGAFVIKESSAPQKVRIVVTDKAGNVTDTDAADFTSSYIFNEEVTVSTNMFVRWVANKPLFYGTIGGTAAVVGAGTGITIFFRKRKLKAKATK